ncbi:MAG: acyl carrier protein [Henriciella sp.]|nr:acyl carrier protein [Henriciella sp.]
MSDKSKIFATICTVLAEYIPEGTEITGDTKIVADLEIDSVDVFDLIMEVEDAYDISISMELISTTHTVGELVDVVDDLIGAD